MQNSASNYALKPDVPEFVPQNSFKKVASSDMYFNIINKEQSTMALANIPRTYTTVGSLSNPHISGSSSSFIANTMNLRRPIAVCGSKPSSFEDLQMKVDVLEEQLKTQQKTLENLTLELQVTKLGNSTNGLNCTNVEKESRIKYLERTFITHWSHSFFSECSTISKHMEKCEKVIANLKLASECLTEASVPSRDQCLASIAKWEKRYQMETDYLQQLTKHYHDILNAIQNEDEVLPYVNIQRPPDINDLPDILHDNFISTFNSLLNAQNQSREQVHMRQHSLLDYCGCNSPLKETNQEQKEIEIAGKLKNPYSHLSNESKPQVSKEKSITGKASFSKQCGISVESQTLDTDISDREDLTENNSSKNRWMPIPQEEVFANAPLPLYCKPDVSGLPEEMQKKFQFRRPSFLVKSVYNSKFIDVFKFIKESVTGISDEEILFCLKNVKERIKSISVMSRDSILAAVIEELGSPLYSDSLKKLENGMCVICFCPFGDESKTRLRCKHTYHTTCVTTYFQADCPLCILSSPRY